MDTVAILNLAATGLGLIDKALPYITDNATIQKVVDDIIAIVPVAISGANTLLPQIQDIIATLSSKDDITDDQITALLGASALIDAHFDATAAAARAADAAAKPAEG